MQNPCLNKAMEGERFFVATLTITLKKCQQDFRSHILIHILNSWNSKNMWKNMQNTNNTKLWHILIKSLHINHELGNSLQHFKDLLEHFLCDRIGKRNILILPHFLGPINLLNNHKNTLCDLI